jgi:similar to stage IV sporulation protein
MSAPVFTLNSLIASGINVKNLVSKDNLLNFNVNNSDCNALESVMKAKNIEYEKNKETSLYTTIKKVLSKIGISVGLSVATILLILYSALITKIEINGVKSIPSENIMSVLESKNVKSPTLASKLDFGSLRLLILEIDGVGDATVFRDGTSLVINIQEELPKHISNESHKLQEIKAKYDCIITDISVFSGTGLVGIGDAVKKGDGLIAPYSTENGVQIPMRAVGRVQGRILHKTELVFDEIIIKSTRTGKTETKTTLLFFNQKHSIGSSFSQYESEVTKKVIPMVLPVQLITTVFYETENVEMPFDLDRDGEKIISREKERIFNAMTANIEAEPKIWHVTKKVDKLFIISIYYEVENEIT